MEERMPPAAGPSGALPSAPLSAPLEDPRAPQLLATEHWSLLATRSMSWNEAFSRTGMFLSTLSAATVALALAGPPMAFGSSFGVFALIVLSVTLFLGVATFVRLNQVNGEDLYWVYGMNILRNAYGRLVPGVEREFVTGHTVDVPGIAASFAASNVTVGGAGAVLHTFVTTPAVVGVVSSVIAGVIGGLVAVQLGVGIEGAVGVGVVVFAASIALMLAYSRRSMARYVAWVARLEAERSGSPEVAARLLSEAAGQRAPGA